MWPEAKSILSSSSSSATPMIMPLDQCLSQRLVVAVALKSFLAIPKNKYAHTYTHSDFSVSRIFGQFSGPFNDITE